MRFCPKCGARVSLKRRGESVVLICPRCGYSEVERVKAKEEESVIRMGRREAVTVIEPTEEKYQPLPTTTAECPKCGYGKAYWWIAQTRSADEAPTRFFRCVKCGYVWREYA